VLAPQFPVASGDAASTGTFAGCGGSGEWISVSLGMVPRWSRVAAARVMPVRRGPRRQSRAGWRRGASLGRPDRRMQWRF
jgi:hypothetical protein